MGFGCFAVGPCDASNLLRAGCVLKRGRHWKLPDGTVLWPGGGVCAACVCVCGESTYEEGACGNRRAFDPPSSRPIILLGDGAMVAGGVLFNQNTRLPMPRYGASCPRPADARERKGVSTLYAKCRGSEILLS